jgi:hypothetical protein
MTRWRDHEEEKLAKDEDQPKRISFMHRQPRFHSIYSEADTQPIEGETNFKIEQVALFGIEYGNSIAHDKDASSTQLYDILEELHAEANKVLPPDSYFEIRHKLFVPKGTPTNYGKELTTEDGSMGMAWYAVVFEEQELNGVNKGRKFQFWSEENENLGGYNIHEFNDDCIWYGNTLNPEVNALGGYAVSGMYKTCPSGSDAVRE